jgi:endonuclease V-like protein UPF0215 family
LKDIGGGGDAVKGLSLPLGLLVVHPEKRGIRALGVAESFRLKGMGRSVLAGVVMRSDLVIDGLGFGYATIGGDDATEGVLRIYRALDRRDINVILLGGAVISYYNVIDVDRVYGETGVPTLSVTYRRSRGIGSIIKRRFPGSWQRKLELYKKLGRRRSILLKTGHLVYARPAGMSEREAKRVLDKFVREGGVPEPIRVARIAAKAALDSMGLWLSQQPPAAPAHP